MNNVKLPPAQFLKGGEQPAHLKRGEVLSVRDACSAYLRGEIKKPRRAVRSPE